MLPAAPREADLAHHEVVQKAFRAGECPADRAGIEAACDPVAARTGVLIHTLNYP